MQVDVVGPDEYGNAAYAKLFENIVGDIGKTFMIKRSKLVLMSELPFFGFSVILRNAPGNKTVSDAASFRPEGSDLYITISNERYAPEILSILWKQYGRNNVIQQTRFDILIHDAKEEDVRDVIIASGEEVVKEMLGAFWRALPEGIRVRETFVDGKVITVMAVEEIMTPGAFEMAKELHNEMIKLGEESEIFV